MGNALLYLYRPIRVNDVLHNKRELTPSTRFVSEYGKLEFDGYVSNVLLSKVEETFATRYREYADIINPLLSELNSEFDDTGVSISNYDYWMAKKLSHIIQYFNEYSDRYIKRYFMTTGCGLAAELINGVHMTFNWYPVDNLINEPNKDILYTCIIPSEFLYIYQN